MFLIILVTLIAVTLAGCSNSPIVSHIGGPTINHPGFRFVDPPTIDWQILDSQVIVVASFVSATATTQDIGDSRFLPAHRLTFGAQQYLKGEGDFTFFVEVVDNEWNLQRSLASGQLRGYGTEEEALDIARDTLPQSDTRPSILFLEGPVKAATSSNGASGHTFNLTNRALLNQSAFEYSINSLTRDWLPSNSASGEGASGASGQTFLTNSTQATITASQLQTRITEIDTLLNARSDGDYKNCVKTMLKRPWYYYDWQPRYVYDVTIRSGAGAGVYIGSHEIGEWSYDYIYSYLTTDSDVVWFESVPRKDAPSRKNEWLFKTTRPMPAGEYELRQHQQVGKMDECGHKNGYDDPGYAVWNVTVQADDEVLYESLFNPSPAPTGYLDNATTFSVGEASIGIKDLAYSNGSLTLSVETTATLDRLDISNHLFQVLDVRGHPIVSEFLNAARFDESAKSFTWTVASQPWSDEDKLMMSIRKVLSEE